MKALGFLEQLDVYGWSTRANLLSTRKRLLAKITEAQRELDECSRLTALMEPVWQEHHEWTVGQVLDHLREKVTEQV
jgi:hypothetical protein